MTHRVSVSVKTLDASSHREWVSLNAVSLALCIECKK
jgi:hypothetical protein